MSTLLRQHAEQQFAEELHELKKNETNSNDRARRGVITRRIRFLKK